MLINQNSKPIIQLKKISKSFPGVQALNEIDFEVFGGEVVALVGENGAGKSTLMKIISGVYEPDAGEFFVDGNKIEHGGVKKAQDRGISIIYQEFTLAPNQTVSANIFLGKEPFLKGLLGKIGIVDSKYMYQKSKELLNQFGAHFSPNTIIRNLSVANQQMVEIAKSLSSKSKIVIMDEPTSSLGKEEVNVLFEIIRTLKSKGMGIIFITHRLEEVFEISDRIFVLRDGLFVKQMMTSEAMTDNLISLMVGRKLDRTSLKTKSHATNEIILEARNLSRGKVLKNVSFNVKKGEIFGICGLVGAGRTETARALFGADGLDYGDILIEGKKVKIGTPNDAVVEGIALVPENRQSQGLISKQSIVRNISLPSLNNLSRKKIVNQNTLNKIANNYIKLLNIKAQSHNQKVLFLSGGNQQKVVIAKWLASNPKILILDEPTRGIDVGAKAEIYSIMNDLATQGIGIIMISSEMPEILMMSDRIMVMCEGKITGILTKEEATQDKIMAYACGQA
jgi:ribose transport system ATP-binding protein